MAAERLAQFEAPITSRFLIVVILKPKLRLSSGGDSYRGGGGQASARGLATGRRSGACDAESMRLRSFGAVES